MVFGGQGDKLLTLCLDRATGKIQWRREAPRSRNPKIRAKNSQSSPSPVTDGENAYVFFEDFGLLSYGPESEYARIRATGNYLRCECAFAFHNELCVI